MTYMTFVARSALGCRANGQTPLHLSGTTLFCLRVWFHNCKTYYLQLSAPSCIHGVCDVDTFYLALWLIVSCNITCHCYVFGFWYACATTCICTLIHSSHGLLSAERALSFTVYLHQTLLIALHENLYVHVCSHMMLSGTACVYSTVRSTNNESKSDGSKARVADRRDP